MRARALAALPEVTTMADWTPPTRDRVEAYFKALNNWGRWGNADQRGTVNLVTAPKQAQARALVTLGRPVSLARDIGPQPAVMYHATFPSNRERADVVLDRFDMVYHGFTITHIDALCHVAWEGELYNGRPFMASVSAAGATWCPIDPLFDGITSRGVLLDVAALRREGYVAVGRPVTPPELDEAARRAGVRVEPGDVVVVRSGQAAFQAAHPDWVPRVSPHPGLHLACLEWFREKDIAAIAWDMMDERPSPGYPGFFMGTHLAIPFLGLALVDNTDPEQLAAVCRELGRYEFLFTAAPLRLVGSTGAPAHPLAIF
jgi:kynurenine formamidase